MQHLLKLAAAALAPQPKKKDDEPNRFGQVSLGAAGVIGGARLAGSAKADLTGRETFYHGTNPVAKLKIQHTGLQAKYTAQPGTATAELHGHGQGDAAEKSKGLVFTTKNRDYAEGMAFRGKARMMDPKRPRRAERALRGHPADLGEAANHLFRQVFDQADPRVADSVVEMEIPTWKKEWKAKMTDNPEYDEDVRRAKTIYSKFLTGGPIRGAADSVAEHVRQSMNYGTFKGDVGPEHVVGSRKFKPLDLDEFTEYASKHPGRIGRGLGTVAVGLGAMALGAKGIHGALAPDEDKK